jgi:hypothetical protein
MERKDRRDPMDIVIGCIGVIMTLLIFLFLFVLSKYLVIVVLAPIFLFLLYFSVKLISRPREKYITLDHIRKKV